MSLSSTDHRRQVPALRVAIAALSLVAVACSSGAAESPTTGSATSTASSATLPKVPADFDVRPGTEQIAVLGAEPGESLVVRRDGTSLAVAQVDEQGSLLFRDLEPGTGYTIESSPQDGVDTEIAASPEVEVLDPSYVPPAALYTEQQDKLLPGGFGYITTRDGTTLSANVVLPGPADGGPYPTVVEYSGYSPSDPENTAFAQLYTALGFAYVGVNMRGTGCSGGSYRFFETAQNVDGYDVVEAIAAQPWVLGNKVGLVGISFSGISQLFVAATRPPSLAAITPLSVIADSYRSTLYPGGILNTGFAVKWTQERVDESKPYGQEWTVRQADSGDVECATNQVLRLQNPDLVEEIDATPFYTEELGDSLAPTTFVDDIDVPVFLAGSWQDEQTGGHWATMIPEFTGTPHLYVDMVNGLHTESLTPRVLARLVEFLQLYVAQRTPDISALNAVGPVLGPSLWGVSTFAPFENRFAGLDHAAALAAFEADPAVRVLFEQGGNAGFVAGTPEPNFVASFGEWPPTTTQEYVLYLGPDGSLAATPPAGDAATVVVSYEADPSALPSTFYAGGGSSDIWRADTVYDWRPLTDGTGLGFVSAPLDADVVMAGSGSVDLWVSSSAPDTDLEVTISEVRPDGTEVYVQSGWLRASHRALDEAASTSLRPVHTHLEADAAELPAREATAVRIELLPFAHPFRAGSRIRLTVDAPGNNRPVWEFRTISDGETVSLWYDVARPARIVLPLLPGVSVDAPAPPACGWLRGQPCRPYVAALNLG